MNTIRSPNGAAMNLRFMIENRAMPGKCEKKENKKMRRQDIVNELKKRGYQAESWETVKNGVVKKGIVIWEKGTVAPIIYTDELLRDAEKKERTVKAVTDAVICLYEKGEDIDFTVEMLRDRKFIRSHLYIGIQKTSEEPIEKRMCEFEGLEAYLLLRGEKPDACYSMKVNRSLLKLADISVEEAWKQAEENTFAETELSSMDDIFAEIFGIPDEDEIKIPIYVLTNAIGIKGAGAILNRSVLTSLAKNHQVDQLIVLPSSIHEMLLIPDDGSMDLDEMSAMVKEVNHTQVKPEERLTDRAYRISI